jgi:hypothetical protein
MKKIQIRWASCILALVLAALPALAETESAPRTETLPAAEALPMEGDAAGAAPEPVSEPLAGRVARASFTTQVVDREPQEPVSRLANDQSQILFFTEFHDLEGHTLIHVWEREGIEMARVPFTVGGPRWRVYSTKNLEPSWLGEWTVRVVDESGHVLHSDRFSYVSAAAEPPVEDAPAASEEMGVPAAIE